MSHTPGPWTLHREGSVRACNGKHDTEEGCQTLAEAEILNMPRAEAEANARLIAAAPELLAALKVAHEFVQLALGAVDFPHDAPGRFTACSDAVNHVEAAIAKAEGR